jgi:hypothetical protein
VLQQRDGRVTEFPENRSRRGYAPVTADTTVPGTVVSGVTLA